MELTKTQKEVYGQFKEWQKKNPGRSSYNFKNETQNKSTTINVALKKMGLDAYGESKDTGQDFNKPLRKKYTRRAMITIPVPEIVENELEKVVAFIGSSKNVVQSIRELLRS